MTRPTFDEKIDRAMGQCRHCSRLCRTQPALHPRIRGAMNVDLRTIGEES